MRGLIRTGAVIVTAAGALAAAKAQEAPVLYGVKLHCDSGGQNGLYSVRAAAGEQPHIEWADGDMMGNGGAVYADGTLYVLTYMDWWGMVYWGYQKCDVESKTYDYSMPEGLELLTDVTGAMTYDPSTATVYCVCLADDTGVNFNLSTMDTATARKTVVAPLAQRLFTLASTAGGQLYGVGGDGTLYKVNKYNGTLDAVGDTGVVPEYNQSAVIDYADGTMYWSAYTSGGGGLYTVDTATAETREVTHYDDGYQFTGLFLKQTAAVNGAPAAVTGLEAVFEGASLTGVLSFTMPETDTDGNALSGETGYTVTLDGNVLAEGAAAPGEAVEAAVTVPGTGMYRFTVVTSSGATEGGAATVEKWVGPDVPQAVTGCAVTNDGAEVTVTWTLPAEGVHGGYVDIEAVTYDIDRGPEDIRVAEGWSGTSYTETVERDGVYPVLYRITPRSGDTEGEPTVTGHILVGDGFTPPFSMDFTDPFMSLTVTGADVNGDSMTWRYDYDLGSMTCDWPISSDGRRDDWLFTPPVMLEEGNLYGLTAELASEGSWNPAAGDYDPVYAGEAAVFAGAGPDPGAMDLCLLPYAEVNDPAGHVRESGEFEAASTGPVYLGVHVRGGLTGSNIYNTLLRSLSMEWLGVNGTEATSADAASWRAVPADGGLRIANPGRILLTVHTPDGRTAAVTSDPEALLPLAAGVYTVTGAHRTVKAAVH